MIFDLKRMWEGGKVLLAPVSKCSYKMTLNFTEHMKPLVHINEACREDVHYPSLIGPLYTYMTT